MKRIEAVEIHLKICEELHALVMEENRILREEQRLPGAEISTRKEGLLQRLNESVAALKAADKAAGGGPRRGKARAWRDRRGRQLRQRSLVAGGTI